MRTRRSDWAWTFVTWLAARRRAVVRPTDVARHLYRRQTRGLGLRMTAWLRDRLRPGWLRLHRATRRERPRDS
jgi:hypothetical protein